MRATVPKIAEAAQAELGSFECSSYTWQVRLHLYAVFELERQVVCAQQVLLRRLKRQFMVLDVRFLPPRGVAPLPVLVQWSPSRNVAVITET